jgi:membrane protease YdiL (CAAX protease family)
LAVVLLFSPLCALLAIGAGHLTGDGLSEVGTISELMSNPARIILFLIFSMLFGPLPEELGWRGYALDRLQERHSALISSLLLGAMWSLWHLPLFLMEGTYQRSEFRSGEIWFVLNFIVSILALTIVMTWVYNNTKRSILSAILIHFMGNLTGEILDLPHRLECYRTV